MVGVTSVVSSITSASNFFVQHLPGDAEKLNSAMKAVSTSLKLQIAQIDDMSFDDSNVLKTKIEQSTFDDATKLDLVATVANKVVELSEAARGIHGPKGQTCINIKD